MPRIVSIAAQPEESLPQQCAARISSPKVNFTVGVCLWDVRVVIGAAETISQFC